MPSSRAAVVEATPGAPRIDTIDVADPGWGEVLIRTAASGVCHSDLHALHDHGVAIPTPFVLGHESSGVVEAIGPGVRGLRPGDHVATCLSVFCGHCPACVSGEPFRCFVDEFARRADDAPRLSRAGSPINQHVGLGSFSELMLVSRNNVVKIRKEMPLDRACLLGCGVLTGVGAVLNTAQVAPGSSVAVIGVGGVGLAIVQGARLAHASTIVAVDIDDDKLALAERLGATHTVNSATEPDVVAAVQQATRGGAQHVFEAIGNARTAQQAVAITGAFGTTTIVGILDGDATVTLSGLDLMMGKRVQQSLMGSNRFVADIPLLVDHYLSGRLELDHLISSRTSLDGLPTALEDLQAGRVLGRTVVEF